MSRMTDPAAYEEALDYIRRLSAFGSHLGLGRVRRLLRALGDPQLSLRAIHVAGTNGKGSVTALMASVLTAAGYRTAVYVQPCWDFADQMRIDGKPIDPSEAARLILEVAGPAAARLAAGGDPCDQVTEFEFVTALAILYAADRRADFLVCEVGLGGRLDATNVFDRPALAVITSIGLDHTDRLGSTLAAITAEKAGIIKRYCPVVVAPQGPEVWAGLAAAARRRGSRIYPAGVAGQVTSGPASLTGQRLSFRGPGFPDRVDDLHLPLLGPHQVDNAVTALTALGVLKERGLAPAVDARALREGLQATVWPGRFELFGGDGDLQTGPASGRGDGSSAKAGPLVVVDGAHNPPGAAALAATLGQVLPGRRIRLVLGLLADKDVEAYLRHVLPPGLPGVVSAWACRPNNPRAMPAEELARRIRSAAPSLPVSAQPEVGEALRLAVSQADAADVVCVAGSLYQVGEARRAALDLVGEFRPLNGAGARHR
jgi:dihydrofolate synthase/folylpolyglutamate synthase